MDRSHEDEEHENEMMQQRTALQEEIKDLQFQLKFYKEKVNRAYLFAEQLDQEALTGVWTDAKEAKMACAGRLRIVLEA
jgi:hypothetical protein